jgi:hypothetical protein
MRLLASICFLLGLGCSQPEPYETDIEYSESWFSCETRFECVVVYDAFCKNVAVNRKFTLIYQDWSHQQVTREGIRSVCADSDIFVAGAGCRNGRCVYPFGLEDYVENPKDGD